MKFPAIKNIIFDFGGVFFDIDFSLTYNAFAQLSSKSFESVFPGGFNDELLLGLETGRVSPDEFRQNLRSRLAVDATDDTLDSAWNALLLGFPEHRIRMAGKVSEQYRIFLLSNTNLIHYQKYNGDFKKNYGHNFDDLFVKAFWSHELGLRKPDKECYQAVLSLTGLKASETVFIDDTRINVDGALANGIHGIHLQGDITGLFKEGRLNEAMIERAN